MPAVHINIGAEQSAAITADVFAGARDYSGYRYAFVGDSYPAGALAPWEGYRGEWAVDSLDPWAPAFPRTVRGAVRELLAGLARPR